MNAPIKRHESLKQISRDHHHGLLLCWKIRAGLFQEIELERIEKYSTCFFEHHLLPHFEIEEKIIFPILGNENEHIKKALSEHRRLKRLFREKEDLLKSLGHIEEELESHIRFEERVLFTEIQQVASEADFKKIEKAHNGVIKLPNEIENWKDKFWEVK